MHLDMQAWTSEMRNAVPQVSGEIPYSPFVESNRERLLSCRNEPDRGLSQLSFPLQEPAS